MSHAAIDSAGVYSGDIFNDAVDDAMMPSQQEQPKHQLLTQAPDDIKSAPVTIVHSLPGYSKWYQGGRVSDRKWFRPCPRQYSTILITDSQGASFARQNHKIKNVSITAYSG